MISYQNDMFKNKSKNQEIYPYKRPLLKSEVRAFMYKDDYKNKDEFWDDVERKRRKRSALKAEIKEIDDMYRESLDARYVKAIPDENYDEIEDIIMDVVGYPSFYEIRHRAGSPEKSYYNGWYYGDKYSRSCPYTQHVHAFYIVAPRVLKIEVSAFDGLKNVCCELLKETHGIKIYKASWVQKKRGFDFEIVSGYVAEKLDESYHADSVKAAIAGLNRKLKRLSYKYNLKEDTVINVSMFRKITGACQAGCQDFLARIGLSEDAKMTVKEVIDLLNNNCRHDYAILLEKPICS